MIDRQKSPAEQYIDDVIRGKIVVGNLVRLAVRRHVEDTKHAGKRGYYFSPEHAEEAIEFFSICRHSKGEWAGEPLELSPWQQFIVWAMFGWRRLDDDTRRFRKAFISVARKNGKSTFCSALALLLFTFDNPLEGGAEVYTAATKLDQARIIYDEAVRMRGQSPSLRNRIRKFQASMVVEDSACKFQPLGGDGDNLDGLNPHGMFLDEIHAWTERHREKYEKLTTAGGSRKQPLIVAITTAGSDKSTLWKEEDDFAVKCVESVETGHVISDSVFSFVARLDDEDDPMDETCWEKANPNLGVSVKLEYLREQAAEAREKPTALNSFKRYHGNIEVTSSERAISAERWADAVYKMDISGERSYGGFDLGRSDDFAAIAVVTPRQIDDRTVYEVRAKSYTSEERPSGNYDALIAQWVKNGHLEQHSGNQVDFSAIEEDIVEWSALHNVAGWWFDATFAQQLSQSLINEHGLEAEKFIQSAASYNEPLRAFLRELTAGNIWHDGCPCLTWQALNLVLHANHRDEWMPDKSHREKKIDAMVATLMAFAQCIFSGEEQQTPMLFFG